MAEPLPEGQMLFTLKEVARYLRTTPWTLRRWIDLGKLPAHKVGGQWRVKREDLEQRLSGPLSQES